MPGGPIELLKAVPGLAGWVAISRKTLRHELYFDGHGVENRRTVEWLGGHVTLLSANGARIGVAGFDISGAGPEQFRRDLETARARGRTVDEPPFALPGAPASGYGKVYLVDPGARDNADMMPLRVRSALEEGLGHEPGARLAAAEISVEKTKEAVTNSAGAAAENDLSMYRIELALLAGPGPREQERLAMLSRRRFEDLDLVKRVALEARRAIDRVEAAPPTPGPTAVLLESEPLGGFIDWLVGATSARNIHRHWSPFTVDRPIASGPAGDPLLLEVNALFPFGPGSYRIDEWGTAGGNIRVIDRGTFVRPHADPRHAALLRLPAATGRPGTPQLPPGSMAEADLRGQPGLEVVAFSDLVPDPGSGRFSAEIRLGYEVRGGKRRPISGGTLSGSIPEALWRARWSKEVGLHDRYVGPNVARFESGFTVTA